MPLLPFPPGDNATDTVIEGVHFNLTTFRRWDYEYYSNGTVSNGSWCMIMIPPYTPKLLLANGTFVNSTWCYVPTNPIGPRAGVGMAFAVLFGIAIVLNLVNLHRHGRLLLPVSKRFYPIGRRWQWYWALASCAFALVGLIASVDVDRFFLPEIPIVLVSLFWYILQMCSMAIVWEAVRHWGSWMERQFIDPDPFALPESGRRYKFEFFIPLVFYLFVWMNFFLVVPRNWGPLMYQRSPEQTLRDAVPAATEPRLKAAAFFLLLAWITIAVSLRHSVKHYQPRNRGLFNRVVGIFRLTPVRLQIIIFLALCVVAYQALVSWIFDYSPVNLKGNVAAIYVGGYLPTLLIIYVQIVAGFLRPNEDQELLRQRRVRGLEENARLGIRRKPAWWRRSRGDAPGGGESMRDTVARNVREIAGRQSATTASVVAARQGQDRTTTTETRAAGGSVPNSTARYVPVDNANEANMVEMGLMNQAGSGNSSRGTAVSSPAARPAPSPAMEPYGGRSERRRTERTMHAVAGILFPNSASGPSAAQRRAELMTDAPSPPPYQERERAEARPQPTEQRNNSSVSLTSSPQQVRSMLDV